MKTDKELDEIREKADRALRKEIERRLFFNIKTMKSKRNLSGIYFRHEVDEKWENWVFEDLPEEKQDEILNEYDKEAVQRLAKLLANTITQLGEHFDICAD